MVAINFRKQWAEAVASGEKRQTIRAPRKDSRAHCKIGDSLQLYVGMRTKGCHKLADATCTDIEPVYIEVDGSIRLGDAKLTEVGANKLARADGFKNASGLLVFFSEVHGLPFEGSVIYWDNARKV